MAERFNIMLAGKAVGVCSLHSAVHDMCADYLTDQISDFQIETSPEDIQFEREESIYADELAGKQIREYSDSYLETLAVYRKIADQLLGYDVLLFHGSAIAVDGVGYLFTAKSGTGKSTHARLWREMLAGRAVMVNDDKPLLKITKDGVFVYGTPWDGKHHLSSNICVPLKAICLLSQSEENRIEPISMSAALPVLLQQSYRPELQERLPRVLALIDLLGASVKLYQLDCNMDPEAARVSYEGMNS